jgi:hypothetical protein
LPLICAITQRINIYLSQEYISKGLRLYAYISLKNKKLRVILFGFNGNFFDVPHINLLAICWFLRIGTYCVKREGGEKRRASIPSTVRVRLVLAVAFTRN